mgnify:CR=1 FL=1
MDAPIKSVLSCSVASGGKITLNRFSWQHNSMRFWYPLMICPSDPPLWFFTLNVIGQKHGQHHPGWQRVPYVVKIKSLVSLYRFWLTLQLRHTSHSKGSSTRPNRLPPECISIVGRQQHIHPWRWNGFTIENRTFPSRVPPSCTCRVNDRFTLQKILSQQLLSSWM